MITYNVLYSQDQIHDKVLRCAAWIDNIAINNPDYVVCPILQSSFYFTTDVFNVLTTTPLVDFCGVNRYDSDGTIDELYMYKGPDVKLYDNKIVILIDTLVSTGSTINYASKLIKQLGAKKVYTASLLVRQFTNYKLDWKGFTIADESVFGYGLDLNSKYRTLPYIAYE